MVEFLHIAISMMLLDYANPSRLFVMAYILGNFLRRLVLPKKIKYWSLRSLLVKLIRIGTKVVKNTRYITFRMTEAAIKTKLFAEILYRIGRLRCRAK